VRIKRPSDAARNDVPAAETAQRRDHRRAEGLIRAASVAAVATATCALGALPAGAATVSAHAARSTTKVSVSPVRAWVGASVTLSATVTSSGKTPTGTVTFKWAGRTLCVGHLRRGSASCAAKFGGAGVYTVRGFYGGDPAHAPSFGGARLTVRRSPTVTTITGPNAVITLGKSYTFNVTVTSPAGTPAPTGTVKLAPVTPPTAPGYTCTATVIAGQGSCTLTPSEYGIDNYTATFAGTTAHTGSVSNGKFTLAVQNPTTTTVTAPSEAVGNVTLDALVFANGANITLAQGGAGSVSFYLSSTQGTTGSVIPQCAAVSPTTFTAAPNFDNVAECTGSTTLNGLAAGTYYITALFSGDPTNVESTSQQFTLTLS
jgi:Bacterial Ig-like domain (group 3)